MAKAANGSAVEYSICVEDASGQISATVPAFTVIRFTDSGLTRDTVQIESKEIQPNRRANLARQGSSAIQGDIGAELSAATFDSLLEGALQGTWATNVLKNGATRKSFAILKRHTDIGKAYLYRGCEVASLTLTTPVDGIATLGFGIIGKTVEDYTVPAGAVFTPANANKVISTSVGSLKEGATTIAYATSLTWTINNGMEALKSLHNRGAYDIANGTPVITGDLSAYFENDAIFSKFLNEAETSLEQVLTDGAKSYTIKIPRLLYTQADDGIKDDKALIHSYSFSVGHDTTANCAVQITRVP